MHSPDVGKKFSFGTAHPMEAPRQPLTFILRLIPGEAGLLSGVVERGPVNHFDFVHRSADISAFAGQSVTLFFEQGDNGPGSNEQRYIDNISIH